MTAKSTSSERSRRTAALPLAGRPGLKIAAVLAIGIGVALGTTGCGYTQNWGTQQNGNYTDSERLNWTYPEYAPNAGNKK